ncbi:hypothetical protein PanWU01x14_189370 [Parasponia andersonii]|uniref:Uncharacterized protein n=1 Tax=Parasponia andersonii TaxID=3476 RepID=A0A2P5C2F6_PARAD|nr:hypothetical protein PanWU01x14_189370 [Parasponia andersonii]
MVSGLSLGLEVWSKVERRVSSVAAPVPEKKKAKSMKITAAALVDKKCHRNFNLTVESEEQNP